ncbi:hypothetical protein N2152v2_000646 [Parachlorella kessleri]
MQSTRKGFSSETSIGRLALAVLRTPLVLLQLALKAPSQPSMLSTLPLPLLENICQHLSRADLWALLRCCKELWQQMQDHPLIWGDLLPAGAFAYVLVSKAPALANLEVLRATCGPLESLVGAFDSHDLRRLKSLTRLRLGSCKLVTVPQELSGLQALRELHLDGNGGLWGSGSWTTLGLERLSHHLSGLTLLSLASCSLEMVPSELSALASLQSLDVSGNVFRNAGHSLQCLRHFTRLTSLNLAYCQMVALPRYLSTLPSLSHLDLSYNPFEGGPLRPSAVLEPNLYGFNALTYLGLRGCRLVQLPLSVTSLTSLKLDFGEPSQVSLWPLSRSSKDPTQSAAERSSSATSSDRLELAVMRTLVMLLPLTHPFKASLLPTLPLALLENICQHLSGADLWALLRCCKELWQQLRDNPLTWSDLYVKLDGGPTTSTVLTAVFGKQRPPEKLYIAVTQTTAFPPLYSLSCSRLTELTLSKAKLMGTLTQLPQLPNVRRLALIECSLPAGAFAYILEWKLPALANLEVLRATCERLEPLSEAFDSRDLLRLKGLTWLRLGSCGLQTVPWQLSRLRALRELHLDGNGALGGSGRRATFGLGELSHLSCLTLLSLASCSLEKLPGSCQPWLHSIPWISAAMCSVMLGTPYSACSTSPT